MKQRDGGLRVLLGFQGVLAVVAGFFCLFSSLLMIEWFLNDAMRDMGGGTVYVFSPILSFALKTLGAVLFLVAWLSFAALKIPQLRRPVAQGSMLCWGFIFLQTLWNMLMPAVRQEIPLFIFIGRMGGAIVLTFLFWLLMPRAERGI